MLLEGFYTVLSITKTETGFSATIQLNEEHTIYKVHFSGNPITPGACIIQILKNLVCMHFGKRYSFDTILNVKFLNVLKPEETSQVTYNVKCKSDEKQIRVDAVVANNDKTYTKISGIFNEL